MATANITTSSAPALETTKAKREFDPTDNNQRGFRYIWEVYPEHWTKAWGNKPLLGYVRADSEFNAYYAAFDKGIAPTWNFPFGVEVNKATKYVRDVSKL